MGGELLNIIFNFYRDLFIDNNWLSFTDVGNSFFEAIKGGNFFENFSIYGFANEGDYIVVLIAYVLTLITIIILISLLFKLFKWIFTLIFKLFRLN